MQVDDDDGEWGGRSSGDRRVINSDDATALAREEETFFSFLPPPASRAYAGAHLHINGARLSPLPFRVVTVSNSPPGGGSYRNPFCPEPVRLFKTLASNGRFPTASNSSTTTARTVHVRTTSVAPPQ